MLTDSYIEALLVDEELADLVWEAWYGDQLNNQAAFMAWMLIGKDNRIDSPRYIEIRKQDN